MTFGEKLKEIRLRDGLTLKEASERYGIATGTYQKRGLRLSDHNIKITEKDIKEFLNPLTEQSKRDTQPSEQYINKLELIQLIRRVADESEPMVSSSTYHHYEVNAGKILERVEQLKTYRITKGAGKMKSYEIVVEIAGELLYLGVPKAIDKDDATRQVYDSDQIARYNPEDIETLEIVEIIEEEEK